MLQESVSEFIHFARDPDVVYASIALKNEIINRLLVIQYLYGKSGPTHMSDKLCRFRATQLIQTQLADTTPITMTSLLLLFHSYKHGGRVLIDNLKYG